jgi:UDP-N-acetylglucosamine/UDP-N-acetylgalactosamine diphosphorylase
VATYEKGREQGEQLLRAGRVAAFTVAGGQGTRLGFDGPKGALPVTPVRGKSLFQLFAEMVLAAGRHYGKPIPWYIMTSPANHAQTIAYFEGHLFFGLAAEDVRFFSQGMLPAFDFAGRLLLEEKHRLAMAPDGHGGSLKAMAGSGALADMRRRGITTLSYFQVDNPLVMPFDPLFIGLHAAIGSEMSTKVTPKADDLERVGNVCLVDGKVTVIEYSDLPENLARARNEEGSRRFDAANIAVHLFDVGFIDRIVGQSFQLPFRRAEKAASFVDETGAVRKPASPNAVKLECFVFDALPLAKNPLVLEVDRAEEFSPVKNATGVDSLATSQRDQVARACRWLARAGFTVPRRANGDPDVAVEIAPTFALDANELASRRNEIPPIGPATKIYLG